MTDTKEKKLVLIVDDATTNIQMVHSMLKDDFKIRVATSGAKALDLVKVKPQPDLILLDVGMPEMDGYEVCAILKSTPEARDIPVIFLTGKTETDDETKGFEAGAVDYIHKPFSPAVVKARVHTHLVLREAREQLARQLSYIKQRAGDGAGDSVVHPSAGDSQDQGVGNCCAIHSDELGGGGFLRLHRRRRETLGDSGCGRFRAWPACGSYRLDAKGCTVGSVPTRL